MTRQPLYWSLLIAIIACDSTPRRADPDAFNVVMISIDTLGADHVGLYGYPRDTTPNLDRFAAGAIVFENAYSTAPKTPESHMSMFTSLYPSVHGVFTITDPSKLNVLDDRIVTFPEILQQHGYTTVGFHAGGLVNGQLGFSRGFDEYRRGKQMDAEAWLQEHGTERKFFLFFHTYRVHDPYTPRPPYDRRFDPDYDGPIVHDMKRLKEIARSKKWGYKQVFWDRVDKNDPEAVAHIAALYDGEIAAMDKDLPELLTAIDRHAPRTIVIFLSDHGEEFGEHGKFRHEQLYSELLHVPFIIWHPDRPNGNRISERVSLLDLAPTILEMLSIQPHTEFQGRSLMTVIDGDSGARPIFSESPLQNILAFVNDEQKLIATDDREELYDLRNDPKERRNLIDANESDGPEPTPETVAGLRAGMTRLVQQNLSLRSELGIQGASEKPSDAVVDQLRALGYLE